MRGCLPPGANVFVAAPTPVIRSPIVILMVTTMALVWTGNSMLSWGVKFQNSIFLPFQMPTPVTVPPGADAPLHSPFLPPLIIMYFVITDSAARPGTDTSSAGETAVLGHLSTTA